MFYRHIVFFYVGLLQSNLHDHLFRDVKCRQAVLIIYIFCYFKFIVLYIYELCNQFQLPDA